MPRYVLYSFLILAVVAMGIRAIVALDFSNTFDITYLMLYLTIVALVTSFFFFRWYKTKTTFISEIESMQAQFLTYFFALIILISIGINLNTFFTISKRIESVQVLQIEPIIQTRGGVLKNEKIKPNVYFIHVIRNGKQERVRQQNIENWKTLQNSEQRIEIRRGLLGFEIFDRIIPNS